MICTLSNQQIKSSDSRLQHINVIRNRQIHISQELNNQAKQSVLALCLSLALGAYVQSVAKELITYGVIAYADPASVKNWNAPECAGYKLTDVNIFSYDPKNLFGFVGYSQSLKAIAIAFRGTIASKLPNVVTDITIFQSDYLKCAGCKVHAGFYDGISLLSAGFISALQKVTNLYPNAPIYIGGHSLGGALASLAAPIIREVFPKNPIAQIITGGKPRVGNKQYATWYNSIFDAYRVVFKNDIVPHVPVSGPLSMFAHHQATHMSLRHHLSAQESHDQLLTAVYFHEAQEVWYTPNWKTFYICQDQDNQCMNSIWAIFYSVPDHMPPVYFQITSSATEL